MPDGLWCFLQVPVLGIQIWSRKVQMCWLLYCPPFSTVYNILLCLHIFSVHILIRIKKGTMKTKTNCPMTTREDLRYICMVSARRPPKSLNVATRTSPTNHQPTQKCPSLGSTCFLLRWDVTFPFLWFKWRMDFFWTIIISVSEKRNTLRFFHCHFLSFLIKDGAWFRILKQAHSFWRSDSLGHKTQILLSIAASPRCPFFSTLFLWGNDFLSPVTLLSTWF